MNHTKHAGIVILAALILFLFSCVQKQTVFHDNWTAGQPIFTAGAKGTFDDIAVKDPSIVFYKGTYHLFYTSKTAQQTPDGLKFVTGTGYAASPSLKGLNRAKRYNLSAIVNDVVIAPQIFYFEPQKRWYLIAQTRVNTPSRLAPIYMTNPDIDNVYGWSKPRIIKAERFNSAFWIDFWVICDDSKAYMLYTDQEGSLWRMVTSLAKFPNGFADSDEKKLFTVHGKNTNGSWRLFEASHTYYVKKTGKYLALLEGAYQHPLTKRFGDARNRFIFAMIADSIDGVWKRFEAGENAFFADAAHLSNADGSPSKYTQVSHPELIRSGYNQKLEIEDYNFQLLIQSFDGSNIPDSYNYNELSWELAIIKNY